MNNYQSPGNMETPQKTSLNHWQGFGESPHYTIDVSFSIGSAIQIDFEVIRDKSIGKWYETGDYSPEYYKNWGLWNTDVVEFFLQARSERNESDLPYIEFLVSPHNFKFALMTLIPRKLNFTPNDLEFQSESVINENQWKTQMKILNPFADSKMLFGNFHACLGSEDQRQYYSAYHLAHPIADFHRPEQFQLLGEL